MELEVKWTLFAEKKLHKIYTFQSYRTGHSKSLILIEGIINKTISLEKRPYIGQKEPLLSQKPQNFRYLIYKKYKIIYWVNEAMGHIEISNVFDCRQNPNKML